ncbi:MAG: hypothetical protein ACI8PT_003355 [Gammaproteobacteria bacterium]
MLAKKHRQTAQRGSVYYRRDHVIKWCIGIATVDVRPIHAAWWMHRSFIDLIRGKGSIYDAHRPPNTDFQREMASD